MMRVAGIMSGTSLDGVDVAIVDIGGRRVETVAHLSVAYPGALRKRILAVSDTTCQTRDISRLSFELGEVYANAVTRTCRRHRIPAESLQLIACHGQTIYHEGRGRRPNTMQIGEASVLAESFGVPVVSDFRTRDIAAGGGGAPLVPLADLLLLHSPRSSRVALNVGGIANITVLPARLDGTGVVAFDTGPGNMVIDQLAAYASGGTLTMDRDGRLAARGHVNRELLDRLLGLKWFAQKPPKTAGREQFGTAFVADLLATGLPMEDLIATATALTAAGIARAVLEYAQGAKEVIAAGGGVNNPRLMAQLAAFLPACRITTTAEFGIHPDAKEAVAFALLGWRTWRHKSGNLPSATGARHSVILGKVTR